MSFPISAVKISSHFHELTSLQKIIIQEKGMIIAEEQDLGSLKDSSRYLQSGAASAIYVQSTAENIPLVYSWMAENLNGMVICESASLGNHVIPNLAVFVSSAREEKQPLWTYPFLTTLMTDGVFTPEISIPESWINNTLR